MPLENPISNAEYQIEQYTYASSGLSYISPQLNQYNIFQTARDEFLINRRVNLENIGTIGDNGSIPWPFSIVNLPINGVISTPKINTSTDKFPLVLFMHGNHDPLENSAYPGYLYLCDLLASQGFISASIDANFLNGENSGENDGRAILILEHLKQFRIWNGTQNHPFHNRIDLENVMIVGHSRGGEAVAHATLFNAQDKFQFDKNKDFVELNGGENGLGPYKFNIKSVLAIAPTDGQYVPPQGATKVNTNYVIIHGSRDGDVINFPGYKTFDRAHSELIGDSKGFKALVWIQEACHNYFNRSWSREYSEVKYPGLSLEREQHEKLLKLYTICTALATLKGKSEYLELLKDHNHGKIQEWISEDIKIISQYQSAKKQYIQHFEENSDTPKLSNPLNGKVDISGSSKANLMFFDLGYKSQLYQETKGLNLKWDKQDGSYKIVLDKPYDASNYKSLSVNLGQSFEDINKKDELQNLSIIIIDNNQNKATLSLEDINMLYYPDTKFHDLGTGFEPKTVMQSIRIPLTKLEEQGINTSKLLSLEIKTDKTPSGSLYVDNLRVSM